VRARLAVCAAPQFLIAFEFSAMTISIAALAADLDLSRRTATLVFSSYGLAFGSLLLAWGHVVDRLGARHCLIAGLAVFAAGIAGTAIATSTSVLIASRALAGIGAAALVPASLAATTSSFPAPEQRRNALSWYAAAISVGFVLGAAAAGVLGEFLGWRTALAATGLAGATVLFATAAVLPSEWRRPRAARPREHHTATVTLAAVVASVAACGLTTGRVAGPLAAACMMGAFIVAVAAWRPGAPHAGMRLPHLAVLVGGGAAVTATGVTGTLLLSLYLREVRSFTPLGTAGLFTAFGVTAFAGRRVARAITDGRDEPAVLCAGLLLQGAALASIALAARPDAPITVLAVLIAVFGLAHVVANAGVALVTATGPDASHGAIAALVATAQYLGGALGPLVIASIAATGGGHAFGIGLAGGVSAAAGTVVGLARRG